MNRIDRDDVRRLQRNVDAIHQMCFNNSTGHASRTCEWDTSDEYLRYVVHEPHGSMDANVGWLRTSPPTQSSPNKQSNPVEDPYGEPLEMDSEDPELTRKRNELREIEEQILQKKVAIALKNVEPFMKKTVPGFCNEESAACTLRDRVNRIVQQRQTVTVLPKVHSPNLKKDGLQREDHPLKLRVKALMKKRCADPSALPTTKDFDGISSATVVNNANEGFQRFLSILNKGVDMDLLSRIVNDDSEELLNVPTEGNKPSADIRSERQRSNSGASIEDKSEQNRERTHNEGLSWSYDDERKQARRDASFGSSRRSKSPVVETKKKTETNPKLDEQHEHLQNILKTLGLNLEVEEMSKLTDRTQERLYGKKHESTNGTKEQASEQKPSQRHYTNSSSSSSSCSSSRCSSYSSRSTSRSFSPSPSRHCRSYSSDSRGSEPRLARGRSSTSDQSRGRLHSNEPQMLGGREENNSTYQHPSYPLHAHPHPGGGLSSCPAGALSQYSQATTLYSGEYSTNTHSYLTCSQGAFPASYSSSFSNPQNAFPHYPCNKTVYPHHNKFEDVDLLVNPDLSMSEGQSGSASGRRCLQVVSTPSASQPCLKQLTKSCKRRRRPVRRWWSSDTKRWEKRPQVKLEKRLEKMKEMRIPEPVQTLKVPESSQNDEAEHLEEAKQQPTEEEIKANLRKKLEAFNQMAKQRVSQPATSQLLKSAECQDFL